ncbi:MAG: hypothetical protein LBQ13_00915 [Endomicrobium sp.]|jgi:small nuclear ribonucleoprotein (snRNP)-like protein|nr:hypothetical protein [Endomicrobium sp.]
MILLVRGKIRSFDSLINFVLTKTKFNQDRSNLTPYDMNGFIEKIIKNVNLIQKILIKFFV